MMSTRTDAGNSQAHLIHAAMRLVRIVRHRRIYLFSTLVVAALLGALYHATALRRFEARTSLMMIYQGRDDRGLGADGYRQGILPTYERLIYSSVVLEDAADQLRSLPTDQRGDLENRPFEDWVDILRANLNARAIRSTNFVEVSFRSTDPHAAVATINAIVKSYLSLIEKNQENSVSEQLATLANGREQLVEQIGQKENELLTAQHEIGDLGLRDGSRVTHPLVHNVVRINEALQEARHDRLRYEATLAALRDAIANGRDLRHFVVSIEDAGGRDTLLGMLGLGEKDQQVVQQIERELSDDRARLESVQHYYGDAHPNVNELRSSIARKQTHLAEYKAERLRRLERRRNESLGVMLQSSLTGKLAAAIAHEKKLIAEYDVAQRRAVDLNGRVARVEILEHDLKMMREYHDTLRNRIANLDIRHDQAQVRMAVVSEAKPIDEPVTPRIMYVVATALFGGVAVGVGLAYVTDVLDDRFRSVDEMREQLDVSILSIVRQLPIYHAAGLDSLQVHIAPQGVESESFRTLRSALAFSEDVGECVAISSSEPGDGKTTVLSNLGVASAQAGKRTLLIDADMRRPGLTRLFELRGQPGLASILQAEVDLASGIQSAIQSTADGNLDILPSGSPPTDPSGLLGHSRFAALVDWACGQYDQVLIDTPPILVASDASIVARLTNGIVLVVDPKKNHRRLVHRAVDEVRGTALPVVGLVVNRVSDRSDDGYGYSYGYGQGYGHGYREESVELEADGEGQFSDGDDSLDQITAVRTDVAPIDDSPGSELPRDEALSVRLEPTIRPRRAA